uniref:Uncharacterized protein n=1 Tax=Arundo donax TaxID=35708 RepID=A0A0A9F0S4_ARUDO
MTRSSDSESLQIMCFSAYSFDGCKASHARYTQEKPPCAMAFRIVIFTFPTSIVRPSNPLCAFPPKGLSFHIIEMPETE